MRKGKREKVIKSKRCGSEWTREEQRRKGSTLGPRGVGFLGVLDTLICYHHTEVLSELFIFILFINIKKQNRAIL